VEVYLSAALLVSVALLVPPAVRAQEITGAVTGTVTDPSGAVVPGAQVTATNVLQGTTWPTETNSAGVYNFPRLPVGKYTIKVEAKGFATIVHEEFELQMNQIARIDIPLKVSAVAQEVTVTTAPPLLQTDTMQVGMVTSSNLNVNLPLATRNYIQLTLLTPGVMTPDPSSFVSGQRTGGGGRPYVNGNREEANNFLLNGIDNNQISDNLTSYQPSPDAIEEFNLITNNAPAQYGQFQGGVVSVNIKSGTDHYHGDIFEFMRNNVLNANNWARNWQGLPTPGLRWNTFGGTVGGPIKKGKLFFFADYEGERLDNPPVTGYITVMTPAERAGDFSQLLSVKGTQLYSPCASLTGPCTAPASLPGIRTPYPNNQITNTIDPVASALFSSSLYPSVVNGNLINNALNTSRSETTNDQGDLKMDYNVSDADHIWGSYSQGDQEIPSFNSVILLGQGFNHSPFHAGTIDWTHTFGPTLVLDARIGLNRIYLHNGSTVPGVGDLATQLGIADGNAGGPGMLGLEFPNGLSNTIGTVDNEELFADTTLEPVVDLILTHNRHTIHIGFQAMRHDINTYYAGNEGKFGYLSFDGTYTSGPNPANLTLAGSSPGFAEADFYLGLPEDVGLGITGATWGQRSWVLAPYVQDDWRVTQHLTLNLGLRWEWNQPWYEVHNLQANFGEFSGIEYLAGVGSCPFSNCRALYNGYDRDFEPRIGFAWSPGFLRRSVIRGAYTISSFLEGTGTNLRLPLNPPFQTEFETTYNTGTGLYFPGSTTDQGLSILTSPSNPLAGALIRLWDPNVRPDTVQQWNFSVEHQLPGDMLASLGYVGQHGTHLMVPMPYFQYELPDENGCPSTAVSPCGSPYLAGNPAVYDVIDQISGTASIGNQSYNALQASLTKHLSNGLEVQASYTYSKCMTNAIGYYGEGGQAASNSAYWQDLYNMTAEWGPCYFDATHTFVGSYVYQLPFGRGKRFGSQWNSVMRGFLGDWQLSGIISAHTGFPITVTGPDESGTKSRGARADCLGPVTYTHEVGESSSTTWFDTSAFGIPAVGTFGNCANGTVRGPGLSTWDMGVQKEFPVTESKRLELRAEFINFTNTPIFDAPSQSVTSATFGEVTSSQGERNIQFALKFYF
jgi:hypothetical protein